MSDRQSTQNLAGLSDFEGVRRALQLEADNRHPFYRDPSGNIVLFRGEPEEQTAVRPSLGDDAVYGEGAYFTNTPSAATMYAYPNRGVGVYSLPHIEEGFVGLSRRFRPIPADKKLQFFPTPLLTLLAQSAFYKDLERSLPPHWALLSVLHAGEEISQTRKIAWIGTVGVGRPRFR